MRLMTFDQIEFDIRTEWGIKGAELLSPISDVIIIIDILSFSTSVDIALNNGAKVYPYQRNSSKIDEYATSLNAITADTDRNSRGKYSLSPTSLLNIPEKTQLVLPSPNGSALSLSAGKTLTLCGCFRNARAVAEYAVSKGKKISVVPAGEKWADGSLRPSFEDFAGAGVVINFLKGELSPESRSAAEVYSGIRNELADQIKKCSSGKELIERGFEADIDLACEINVSNCVPGLINGAYIDLNQTKKN